MSSNTISRRVTVVMADAYHNLKLVEVMTRTRYDHTTDNYRIDRTAVEAAARERLGEQPTARPWENGLDFVGVLVAHHGTTAQGRITWATEIEVVEAVGI